MINRAGLEKINAFDEHEDKTVKEYSTTLASFLAFLVEVHKTFAEAVKEPLGSSDATVVQFLLHEAAHNPLYKNPDKMQHCAMHIQRAYRSVTFVAILICNNASSEVSCCLNCTTAGLNEKMLTPLSIHTKIRTALRRC
jgi:hypothetical protein